jgi:lycopene beta-cyclase
MTYFGFLLRFLFIPILIFIGITLFDARRKRKSFATLQSWPAWAAILLHVVIAVTYTTPWDNYLVATSVWWYDPALVSGITIGWVPIEEYTFFVVQPLLTGLWLLFLSRRLSFNITSPLFAQLRKWGPIIVGMLWIGSLIMLLTQWQPDTYLALELGWALPPIMLQLAFGADILWRYRRILLLTIIPVTLYLSAADAIAINLGTWTINPAQSLNLLISGILPIEEFLFFLLTNTLLTFGVILILATESHARIKSSRWLNNKRRPVGNN